MEKYLYDTFASRWYRGGTIWFYSDPHFCDEEMKYIRKNYIGDKEQVKRINRRVGRNDTIIILGDVGDPGWVRYLRGYKVLIMGNHDAGATNYKREIRHVHGLEHCPICGGGVVHDNTIYADCGPGYAWCPTCGYTVMPTYDTVVDNHLFDEVYEGALMISPKIVLSHEPLPNLPEWLFNIHGHDHSNWFTGSRHLNCCAEHINYEPVSLPSIVKSGVLHDVEDIHRITIDSAIERKQKRLERGEK